jgi:phosphatidate cytidylyltransferase
MARRAITSLALVAIGLPAVIFGGIPYFLLMGFFLCAATWEYLQTFQHAGLRPARRLTVLGVGGFLFTAQFWGEAAAPFFTFFTFLLMAWHLHQFERGQDHAAEEFAVGISAFLYLGWIGSYLLRLRMLPDGGWWVMFVLPTIWMVDTGAYAIGAAYGKHPLAPRLSPKKTWEGFAAGAFTGALAGIFFAYAYSTWGPLHLPLWQGALFGLAAGIFTPLGDLGESMFKRQAGMKDSGSLIPGHGGAFDRIDSWLWGAALGYYFITWFVR